MQLSSMRENDLVSIIVPNYNNVDYIRPFIDSVLAQSYTNWELLIVDDHSTNESPDIINVYVQKDKRIHLFTRDRLPKGACTCRNIGMEKACGQYVCFFDSDDLLPEYCIETRVNEINKTSKDVGFIVFPVVTFKEKPLDINRLVLGFLPFKNDLAMFLKRYRLPFAVCTNIYKKKCLIDNGLHWNESLKSLQDSDFNIEALSKGIHYKYSDDKRPSYFWRIGGNPNSITKSIKSVANINSQLAFYDKLLQLKEYSKYVKEIRRFGKTLLLRCLICGYPTIPMVLVDTKYTLFRIRILRELYSWSRIQNEYFRLFLFAMCFPIDCLDELCFRLKNRHDMRRYFKANC